MTAQVSILTGRKTVLDYLLKPLLKARHEAMTERWERETFDALSEGFARRGVPVNPAFEPWNLFR